MWYFSLLLDNFISKFFIDSNKENDLILNQIYDTPIELYNQEKQITLCKVSTNKRIENSNKAAK